MLEWILAVPALVLMAAGVIKLRNPWPASFALVDFGFARRLRKGLGEALGFAEVMVGAMALTAVFVHANGLVMLTLSVPAASLLVVFAVLILRQLLRGRRVPCGCFGARSVTDWWSAVRTLSLAAAAWAVLLTRA